MCYTLGRITKAIVCHDQLGCLRKCHIDRPKEAEDELTEEKKFFFLSASESVAFTCGKELSNKKCAKSVTYIIVV